MQYKKMKRIGIQVSALALGILMSTSMPVSVMADETTAVSTSSDVSSSSEGADPSTSSSSELPVEEPVVTPEPTPEPEEKKDPEKGKPEELNPSEAEPADSEEKKEKDSTDSEKEKNKEKNKEKTEAKKEKAPEASKEAQEENKDKPEQTNEELVKQQHLVHVEPVEADFRFRLVERDPIFAKGETSIFEDVSDSARAVGVLQEKDVAYLLKDFQNGWLYVESGTVRGFAKSENFDTGANAKKIAAAYAKEAGVKAQQEHKSVKASDLYHVAKELVAPGENQAYYACMRTVYDRVIPKKYALTSDTDVNIREDMSEESRIVGHWNPGQLAYVIANAGGKWVYMESGDVRGFVSREFLHSGDEVDAEVAEKGESSYGTAAMAISPRENAALHYTSTSIKQGSETNPIREAVIKTAENCIGNPYVWGGSSLTSGADCSGFVQTLFAQYGITLPRVADQQSVYGTQIPVEEASPGDLIFFATDGYVYHVALYIGNGQTIEAFDAERGIIRYTVDTEHAVWATRVIPE